MNNNSVVLFLSLAVSLLTGCGEQRGENPPAPAKVNPGGAVAVDLRINEREYFEAPAVNILAFSNPPGGLFNDSKTSGVEIIHRGERIATNGDLRFLHTPEQWDGLGEMVERSVHREAGRIETTLEYPQYDFSYRVAAQADGGKLKLSVHMDKPLPEKLAGKAGFNMEFLPAAYFGKAWQMDDRTGIFPRHPVGPMRFNEDGLTEPLPLARGRQLVLAPENPKQRIAIRTVNDKQPLMLFDGRNKVQNGWFVCAA